MVGWCGRWLSGHPTVLLAAVVIATSYVLGGLIGLVVAVVVGCALAVLICRGPRGVVLVLAWCRVARACGVVGSDGRAPLPRLRRLPSGMVLRVRVPLGRSKDDLVRAVPELSAGLGRDIRILPESAPSQLRLLVLEKEALPERVVDRVTEIEMAPGLAAIPVGISESGEPWELPLDGGSVVIGGEPGGGKSSLIAALLGSVVAREDVQLVAIDLKEGVELASWETRCAAFAADQNSALEVLDQVEEIRVARMAMLRRGGVTSISRIGYSVDLPMLLVIVDEAAELFSSESPAKADKDRAVALVRVVSRLVRLGRAAGVVVVLATQKPTAESIPTVIRDAAAVRVATRCTTREQARAVLGDAESLVSPTTISRSSRGVAVAESGQGLALVRAPFITESVRLAMAKSAARLARPLSALMTEPPADGTSPLASGAELNGPDHSPALPGQIAKAVGLGPGGQGWSEATSRSDAPAPLTARTETASSPVRGGKAPAPNVQ